MRTIASPVALFKTKTKEAAPVKEAPAKKAGGWFSPKPKQEPAQKPSKASSKASKAAEYKKGTSVLGSIVNALDFNEVRSQSDAELLYDAKYGKRGEDGRMTREQYSALRRRVVGTSRDFFKEWVDVKGAYVEKGFVSTERTTVPGLPFLVLTVVALVATLAYVVVATS